MARALLAAAGVCLVLGLSGDPRPARGDFESRFAALRAELEHRRDDDLAGTLDRTQKAQRRAVLKALALLDRPAKGLKGEISVARKVVRLLAKPFAEELTPPGPSSHTSFLGTPLGDILQALQDEATAVLAEVEFNGGVITGTQAARLDAAITRAETALAAINQSTLTGWAANLLTAYRQVQRSEQTVARVLGSDGKVVITLDGEETRTALQEWLYFAPGSGGNLYFELFGRRFCPNPPPETDDPLDFTLDVNAEEVTARPGTFDISLAFLTLRRYDEEGKFVVDTYRAFSGALVLTTVRKSGNSVTVAGTFAFTCKTNDPVPLTRQVAGVFKKTYNPAIRIPCVSGGSKR